MMKSDGPEDICVLVLVHGNRSFTSRFDRHVVDFWFGCMGYYGLLAGGRAFFVYFRDVS